MRSRKKPASEGESNTERTAKKPEAPFPGRLAIPEPRTWLNKRPITVQTVAVICSLWPGDSGSEVVAPEFGHCSACSVLNFRLRSLNFEVPRVREFGFRSSELSSEEPHNRINLSKRLQAALWYNLYRGNSIIKLYDHFQSRASLVVLLVVSELSRLRRFSKTRSQVSGWKALLGRLPTKQLKRSEILQPPRKCRVILVILLENSEAFIILIYNANL